MNKNYAKNVNNINAKAIVLIFSFMILLNLDSRSQVVEAEGTLNWVENFGGYAAGWSDRTAAGASGRKAGSTGSWRARYMLFSNLGITPGSYDVVLRWYDETADTLTQMAFQIGQRTCNGPKTEVCTTGVFAVRDAWFADTTAATFALRGFKNVSISAADTLFLFIKSIGNSNAAWFDKIEFFAPGTGIEEASAYNGVDVFPNPFSTKATISFKEEQIDVAMRMYDMMGRVVQTNNLGDGRTFTIEKGELPKAMYYIHVTSKNKLLGIRKTIVE